MGEIFRYSDDIYSFLMLSQNVDFMVKVIHLKFVLRNMMSHKQKLRKVFEKNLE